MDNVSNIKFLFFCDLRELSASFLPLANPKNFTQSRVSFPNHTISRTTHFQLLKAPMR